MSRPQHSTALRLRRQHLVNNLMSKINPIEILRTTIFACEVDPPLFTVYFVHSNTYKMYNWKYDTLWRFLPPPLCFWEIAESYVNYIIIKLYLHWVERHFNQLKRWKFSIHVFSTNHKGEEVHKPIINYFNFVYRLPRKITFSKN